MRQRAARTGGLPIRCVQTILETCLRLYVASRLSREVPSVKTLEAWVRFVSEFRVDLGPERFGVHFSLRPAQIPVEIIGLLKIVAQERPRRILEVGSAEGGTLFLFARAAAPDALLIGMDLPSNGRGGLSEWRANLYESAFPGPGQRVVIVRADSHSDATRARIRAILRNEPIDLLFLDADHTYEGVTRDFQLYAPLVRPGGIICLHDIVRDSYHRTGVRTSSDSGEVFRFWEEIREKGLQRGTVREIVEDPNQDGYGIGILRV